MLFQKRLLTVIAIITFTCSTLLMFGQNDMALLDKADTVKDFTTATFKGTRIINLQSVETCGKRVLEFMIQHRFGDFNGGASTLWGLDNSATIRFGLGYGISERLEIGIGRTNFEKLIDGYLKYKLIRQSPQGSPFSLTLFGSEYYIGQQDPDAVLNGYDKYRHTTDRMSSTLQVIIARKFSDKLSIQITPMYLHYNLVDNSTDKNDVIALGFAGRYKFSRRMAITYEYGLRSKSYSSQTYYNTMGIGWEIETGGHVFQMFFTNSAGIADSQFIAHTTTSWNDGGVRLGFNISRAFNF